MGNGDSASRVLLQRCGPDYRLTTFRGSSEAITTDPRERTDGDMTAWTYNAATGLPTRKTYADETHEDTSYDTLNRVSTFTNGRGNVMTRSYDALTGC